MNARPLAKTPSEADVPATCWRVSRIMALAIETSCGNGGGPPMAQLCCPCSSSSANPTWLPGTGSARAAAAIRALSFVNH